jgi:hypothetical protein
MRDHSMGGFWSACVVEGIAFFFVRNHISGLGRVMGIMVPGLIAYYTYVGLKKSKDDDSQWSSQDVFIGFLVAVVAGWVPALLSFIFGWGPNYYSGY